MDLKNLLMKVPGVSVFVYLSDRFVLCHWARKNMYRNRAMSVAVLLAFVLLLGGGMFLSENYAEEPASWNVPYPTQSLVSKECKNESQRPRGSEPLPRQIVEETSDLEMRPLWSDPKKQKQKTNPQNLLAIPVGIKQKEIVNQMVKKFPARNFTVMLFHYDGIVDRWNDLEWSSRAIHIAAKNQTKWWFAKRFLHPDIIDSYNYIFLWDEDLGVKNFNPDRYLAIMEDEGFEISQPGLDLNTSEVHHRITVRGRSRTHRRIYKLRGSGQCHANSTEPPCTGWVEMMAPVFSRAAWRCAWYMIQNDLVHAWGVDMKLGYCAQELLIVNKTLAYMHDWFGLKTLGARSEKVGVIDSEYIVHKGIPSLGGPDKKSPPGKLALNKAASPAPESAFSERAEVRRQSYTELDIFNRRWAKAAREDKCWVDPYPRKMNNSSNAKH